MHSAPWSSSVEVLLRSRALMAHFLPLQTELCYTNAFQHSPPPVPCELVTNQPGFRQFPSTGSLYKQQASVLQAGIMESRCLLHPAGFTLAGVNAPSLYAINHQPCKLHDSLLCMPSIKQQIMTSLRSPGTHLLAFPSSQNEMYHPFQGLGSPLPRRLQSCSSILYRFASSHQQCDDWQGAESLITR
jgi:hypothetical protein